MLAAIFDRGSIGSRIGLITYNSPQLPDGEAYGLRIRFPGRLGHHTLIVESKVCTTPKAQSHASADPERVCHIVLTSTVDAGFASDVVICVDREPERVREIVARMLF